MNHFTRSTIIGALTLASVTAYADPALNLLRSGDYTQGSFVIGFLFQPTSTIDVDALGWYQNGTPWASSHEVGLYAVTIDSGINSDANGRFSDIASASLVASTTVTSADTYSASFRYSSISTVQLSSNQLYAIVGVTGHDDYNVGWASFTVNPNISFLGGALQGGSIYSGTATSLLAPAKAYTAADNRGSYNAWATPNFEIQSTPEPSSLLALGLLGVPLMGKRRRS